MVSRAEPIDIVSEFHSLSNSRFQEICTSQRRRKLLDKVHAAIRLKHYPYSTAGTAWPFAALLIDQPREVAAQT